jgi:hypothetical protein
MKNNQHFLKVDRSQQIAKSNVKAPLAAFYGTIFAIMTKLADKSGPLVEKPKLFPDMKQFLKTNLLIQILFKMQYSIKKIMLTGSFAIAGFVFAGNSNSVDTNKPATAQAVITPTPSPNPDFTSSELNTTAELYNLLHLEEGGMKPEVLELAIQGLNKLATAGKLHYTDKITIVDFSQPSTKKRLYVIDLDKKQLLFQSLVSHGSGTGALWAKFFSNRIKSHKSSPGFYITGETYTGSNGYSLRLDGVEGGINDNARNRAIVMHGADYANASTIGSLGFLGRSQGCPALPLALHKPVINTIKNGTCLFIYTPDKSYLQRSEFLS